MSPEAPHPQARTALGVDSSVDKTGRGLVTIASSGSCTPRHPTPTFSNAGGGWENRLQLVLVCSHLEAHLHLAMAESLPRELPVSLCSSPSTIKTKAVFHREVGEWVVGSEAYLRD